MIEIKKKALEAAINESVKELTANRGLICEDRFAIHCGNGFEVQVVITTEEDDFLDSVLPQYESA